MIDVLAGYVIWAIIIALLVLVASLGVCIAINYIKAMVKGKLRRR